MIYIKKYFSLFFIVISFSFTHPLLGNNTDSIPTSAKLLSRYVQIPSVTGNEREAGIYLSGLAAEMGLFVEIFSDKLDSYNFTASLYPLSEGKPNIVFLTHIDVVEAQDSPLNKYPPFSGAIAEGYIWGRGSIDNKGMGIMQLLAIAKYIELARTTDLPFNITLLGVSNEEVGGTKGAKWITENHLTYINPVVVYGEGGSGFDGLLSREPEKHIYGICVAAKRSLWLELTLNVMTSGHGSVPPVNYSTQQTINALERVLTINRYRPLQYTKPAIRMFREVGEIEGGFRGFAFKNISFFSPLVAPQLKKHEAIYSIISNTITITCLYTTPGAPNVIPHQTKAILDCRLLPEVKTSDFLTKLKKWLMNDSIRIQILSEGIEAPSTVPDHFFYRLKNAIKKIYPDSEVISLIVPASNDNNFFRAKGIPTYGIFPAFLSAELMSSIHNVNERIPIQSIENGIKIYEDLIHSILFDPEIPIENE